MFLSRAAPSTSGRAKRDFLPISVYQSVWALIIIGLAYFIAGWSFRLSHFGLVFVWDFVTRRRNRFVPDQSANRMFLARKINEVPIRSYGKLLRDAQGSLVLIHRLWLVLRERALV